MWIKLQLGFVTRQILLRQRKLVEGMSFDPNMALEDISLHLSRLCGIICRTGDEDVLSDKDDIRDVLDRQMHLRNNLALRRQPNNL